MKLEPKNMKHFGRAIKKLIRGSNLEKNIINGYDLDFTCSVYILYTAVFRQ